MCNSEFVVEKKGKYAVGKYSATFGGKVTKWWFKQPAQRIQGLEIILQTVLSGAFAKTSY